MTQQALDHALDVAVYASKWAIALAAIYAFVEKVGKPYYEFRKKVFVREIRAALAPELEQLTQLKATVDSINAQQRKMLRRQRTIYHEVDAFIEIATDNRERNDESAELLDQVFHLERRVDLEKRKQIDTLLAELRDRQATRRMTEPDPDDTADDPELTEEDL